MWFSHGQKSRLTTTSHYYNPFFAIDDGKTDENRGEVYFGLVAWSGNWKIVLEKNNFNFVRAVLGINNFDKGIELGAKERFETPKIILGYAQAGYNSMSQILHKYQKETLLKDKNRRPVLYNSWEATYFDVTVDGQKRLAEKAAYMGVELFVVDDGWFGERNSDAAGLGDWFENKNKFPAGIEPLVRYINELGMKFGIWIEPEMVNADSNLYREHPEWVISFDGRKRTELRNQMVLNLGLCEVREYIKKVFDNILSNKEIKFIKWDMNRAFSEPGYEVKTDKDIWLEYVKGLYMIMDYLKGKYSEVEIESCSGGGGRIDLAVMERIEQFWTSDNTDPFDRLFIQQGYSYAYAPRAMMCWVTDAPNFLNGRKCTLEYRFNSAMQGSLGIGMNLNKLSNEEIEESRRLIEKYKGIREIIQNGRLVRLHGRENGEIFANQYVSEDDKKVIVFVFIRAKNFGIGVKLIKLAGLKEEERYINKETGIKMSGKALMEIGLRVEADGDYYSKTIELEID